MLCIWAIAGGFWFGHISIAGNFWSAVIPEPGCAHFNRLRIKFMSLTRRLAIRTANERGCALCVRVMCARGGILTSRVVVMWKLCMVCVLLLSFSRETVCSLPQCIKAHSVALGEGRNSLSLSQYIHDPIPSSLWQGRCSPLAVNIYSPLYAATEVARWSQQRKQGCISQMCLSTQDMNDLLYYTVSFSPLCHTQTRR